VVSVTIYYSVILWVFQCFTREGKYPYFILQTRQKKIRGVTLLRKKAKLEAEFRSPVPTPLHCVPPIVP